MDNELTKQKIIELFTDCLEIDVDGTAWMSPENYEYNIKYFNEELDKIYKGIEREKVKSKTYKYNNPG